MLGNLLPGQTARIDIQMIKPLTIECGAFEFILPTSFMPQYNQHEIVKNQPDLWYLKENIGAIEDRIPEYSFNYNFTVLSKDKITFLSAPKETVKTPIANGGYTIEYPKLQEAPKREIKIYYKT